MRTWRLIVTLTGTAAVAAVLGGAWWRDRAGWRRRLALDRERPNGMRPVALLGLLLIWPVLHIAWVTGTAELFGASFGQHVRLSPFMSQAAVAAIASAMVPLNTRRAPSWLR